MNTRNAYAIRAAKMQNSRTTRSRRVATASAPAGLALANADSTPVPLEEAAAALSTQSCSSLPPRHTRHPLTDGYMNARLAHCEESVNGRFDAIIPALRAIADRPYGSGYDNDVQKIASQYLGYKLPQSSLEYAWIEGPNMKKLYGHCAFTALQKSVEQFTDDLKNQVETVQDTRNFFLDCGYHAVDISPCSDGRLKGLMRYILRLPLSSFTRRKAYAGALFDVETDVKHWADTELKRFREGVPSTVDSGTRYLKIAVYHFSTSMPTHEGCAAHGSNDKQAIGAAIERLEQFKEAIENSFCCGATTDILLIGVDTDNDSIRVHTPDSTGKINAYRYVDNAELYASTVSLTEDDGRISVHETIRNSCMQDGWAKADGEPHEGMRRLIANLLINNLSQIDYVSDLYGGVYSDIGHGEKYISVGDGIEEVQMRNLAYYAHLHTLEEGVADMDVGIKILTGLNVKHGLPIPIAIHYRYDAKVPSARERVIEKAQRVKAAIQKRYADLDKEDFLAFQLTIQDRPTGSEFELVESAL
ncbi:MAG: carboxysome shell protein CsoS3 [uncultured Thiotrichaceae bacterium]|uniref:Carboxysome shell carbonic anhydrase n=1 Tax=uncultured Thiotrichaceae bacterium TaxID=298394 RepID=A0A6S6U8X7_9GAMM|nr:MAG: carboxysome shell protein CsoS3 [uncultured Thiotrichaceae bacterium]